MKKILKFKKEFILLLMIIVLASFLRLYNLGNVPVSLTDDEIRLVYSGYSISSTGKDAFGNNFPSVFHMDGANTYGQVPIYIMSLIFLFLPLNPFIVRLPFAMSGILSVILIYFIIKRIINSDKLALISSFALSVSVWSLQLTRFVIEINIAVTLYLAGILTFLYCKKNLKLLLTSMFLFFLAFYTYAATKIIFIPLILVLVWYKFKDLSRRDITVIVITTVLAFGLFAYLSVTQGASSYSSPGGNPFFFQDKEKTALTVELERRASNEPQIIKSLYHNKFTYWGRSFTTNYLTAFSPQYLFLDQEASGIYSIWGRGEMYIFELPLLILGFLYLFIKKRKEFYLILILLLISPLPSALGVNTPTWTSRSGFMLFWLYTFVGAGIYYLLILFKKQNYRYLVFTIIALFYLYGVTGYLSQYYYDWSRTNAKYFSKSTKDLVYKIGDYQKEGKKVIVSGAGQNTFLHYAFYNKLDPQLVQKNMNKYPIKFSNFIFYKECLKKIPKNIIYIALVSCEYDATPSAMIKEFNNPVTVWNIYEN
ncbi:MAG: hypothetical protein COY68_03730 [Candidatus Levybacteria bacterium CG_4_10_14_0_8_um_filter_35_23]|nr:MAG: hypothetical protein COY68_03730 [Candidatus Levybacteria bacterium CG_4_10_14_0_8_um_filter_35_23]